MLFVTLLLPVIVPYGCPVTFLDPRANYKRETEFFTWITSVKEESPQYPQVPLLKSEEFEKHQATFIEGEQETQTKFVPSRVS
ncbi:hypothetical protein [Metabacillus halosaccharovorans]|uniref:hypothetical protein n=1 Tax=Metabacillus halosaccharovorans TaxID=930124 RepID=UPI000994AA14|nr:hypothetical protein [Metabacillus halosaccharovorans]